MTLVCHILASVFSKCHYILEFFLGKLAAVSEVSKCHNCTCLSVVSCIIGWHAQPCVQF